ncbi:hypothetical protein [Nostoc sp. T09]|nr:hypothetical protein [Nostoc sp. T09]
MQTPKGGLRRAAQRKMLLPQIAAHFGASESMLQFSSNVTGAPIQC